MSMTRLRCFDIAWLALFLISMLVRVSGKGLLELTMVRYVNKGGLTAEKKPCSVTGKCDLYFLLKLDGKANASDDGADWSVIETDVFRKTNGSMRFGLWTSQHEKNPIERRFDAWKGVLNFKLIARHSISYYPNTGDILVDNMTANIKIEADAMERQHEISGSVHGLNSRFSFKLRVTCARNYYTRECSKHCEPHNDHYYGHYYCTKDGDKVCLPEWRDLKSKCLERDYCASQPCQNKGICKQVNMWDYKCTCTEHFTGQLCEQRRPLCEVFNPCLNGGTCNTIDEKRTLCSCTDGWAGPTCNEDRDECLELPCSNGGRCRNLPRGRGFECDCTGTGYVGSKCKEDIDECAESVPVCKNNGTCKNKHGSFQCKCHTPFYGKDCSRCNATLHPLGYCPQKVWTSSISSAVVPAVLLFLILMGLVFVVILKRRGALCRAKADTEAGDEAAVMAKLSPTVRNPEPPPENYDCAGQRERSARNGQIPGNEDATSGLFSNPWGTQGKR